MKARYVDLFAPIAAELNVSLDAFGDIVAKRSSEGHVRLSVVHDQELEPSPITSSDVRSTPWAVLSGTILGTLQSAPGNPYAGKKTIVHPSLILGT